MIRILKASAGSGKTFNLAKTYIEILLKSEDRYAYRGVLAVTFTNKATSEMKNRILKELAILAGNPQKSGYYDSLVPSLFDSPEPLRQKAGSILIDILHDYGAFSISTIDKFFQQTLKSFARELGQFSSYQIELDKKSLVHESVDRLLDSLTRSDVQMMKWLNENVMEQMEKGERVNVEKNLYEMAERLSSEEHRLANELYGLDDEESLSRTRLSAIRKECSAVISSFAKDVRDSASAVAELLRSVGVPPEDSKYKFLQRVVSYSGVDALQRIEKPTDAVLNRAADPDQWFSKALSREYIPRLGGLSGLLEVFCSLFGERFRLYNTAYLLKSQVYALGFASEFHQQFNDLLKEKNVLSLDDTNTLLRRIIDGSDAPFVYEKTGVRYRNFLLDEFQDTSTVQWQNFYPLLYESVSSGESDLVVGDVKQSIYRWRGSEWELLDNGVQTAFPGASSESLKKNWRSCRTIVDFNNDFFVHAAAALDGLNPVSGTRIADLYVDVSQTAMNSDPQEGFVKVSFCPKDEELTRIAESIGSAREAGALWSDIAILVRNNKEGGAIASDLISRDIPVLSDDSLDVKSSVTVQRLVALLKCIDNPDDSINAFISSSLDVALPEHYHSLVDLCEELLRRMSGGDDTVFDGEVLYIQSFMDALQDWTSLYGNNLAYFLKYWDEKEFRVSSPSDVDAVRILTVHKSKGLEFPYVIFPFAETVTLWGKSCHWCRPDGTGKGLDVSSSGIYPIDINKSLSDTLFSSDLEKEMRLQLVDSINLFYVALTRAEKSLHIIASLPPAKCIDACQGGGAYPFADFSQILYSFTRADDYSRGREYDFTRMKRPSQASAPDTVDLHYRSIPINPEPPVNQDDQDIPVNEAGRLKFSRDSVDFFGDDGSVGIQASNRLAGIVLHDILAKVRDVSDLHGAVTDAVYDGYLSEEEGRWAERFLSERIKSMAGRGWFVRPVDEVSNERTLIDTDGLSYRPDRVLNDGDSIVVIDYKFGSPKKSYRRQVSGYMDIYRRLGYADVKGYLWYVVENEVVELN